MSHADADAFLAVICDIVAPPRLATSRVKGRTMKRNRLGGITIYSKEVKDQVADLTFAEYAARRREFGTNARPPSESEIGVRLIQFALLEMKRQGRTRVP